jgi:hypothetical protein
MNSENVRRLIENVCRLKENVSSNSSQSRMIIENVWVNSENGGGSTACPL